MTQDFLVDGNYVHDNGIENSIYEHNNYTEATRITFQYKHFGPLRAGCLGNNLKDRSAGTVVRYNWIEGGAHLLDLVDPARRSTLFARPDPALPGTYRWDVILQGARETVFFDF